MAGIDDLRKPIEGYIGGEYTYVPACGIVDGHGVGGHDDLTSALVEIGLAPASTPSHHRGGVPLHGVVAIGVGAQLLLFQTTIGPVGVGGILLAFLGVIVGFESHGAPHDDFVVEQCLLRHHIQGIRL